MIGPGEEEQSPEMEGERTKKKEKGERRERKEEKLTAINRLRSLLLDSASIILRRSLRSQTSRRAVLIKVAALVHGLLKRIALPAEDVVTVGGGATVFAVCQYHIFHCTMRQEIRTRWTETLTQGSCYTQMQDPIQATCFCRQSSSHST
nr:hypothetical protein B1D4.120 [imported] - Neurospora crassa [Neurospora crassa]